MAGKQWRFFRAGGVDQVQIQKGTDLVSLGELDQKLWVALSCPVEGLEFDKRTLELIDDDHDGRVRAPELIAAVEWAGSMVKDPEELVRKSGALPLSAIDASKPDGKLILDTARALLAGMGKPEATAIAVAEIKDAIASFEKEKWNGDGVVPADSADAPEEKKLVEEVLSCTETPDIDKSTKPGITSASVEKFFVELAAFVAWRNEGASPQIMPLGEETADAHAAFAAVREKIDDYFGRSRLAAFDPRAITAVNREEKEYLDLAAKDLHVSADEIAHFPLAQVAADRPLPLVTGVNPAWADRIEAFRVKTVGPLFGPQEELTPAEWSAICSKLAPHSAWLAKKAGASVEKLGADRARELSAGNARERLDALLAKEEATKPLAAAIERVERLVHYNRDLFSLANNFVAFRDFYTRAGPSIFQVGTLYLDQRATELCIRVNDAKRHATMSPFSRAYLLYCDLKNAKGETMSIAAAMMDGDSDNLMVGRNGLFYDRKGQDWDATITKIVDNPISIRQAFWSPYKKALRFLEEQMSKRAAAAEAESDKKLAGAATISGKAPLPEPKKFDVGVVAALGVAVGGIVAALGVLAESFFGLGLWMPLGFLALILAISGPSMAIAWLKLRQRNLGPILDANGWAVNARAKINVPLGKSLTKVATLPAGAQRDLADPFAEKRRPWKLYFVLLVILGLGVGWYLGKLDGWLPEGARSTTVLGDAAPANAPPPPPVEAPPAG